MRRDQDDSTAGVRIQPLAGSNRDFLPEKAQEPLAR
jgi:hypothetical protein